MSKLLIQNDGEVDINALLLVGASTKEGDDTKIGFFGSGNKYALACLTRNNIGFKIFSGEKLLEVTTAPVALSGQEFHRIVVDGQPTSLTTRMGPKWEPWMALREFSCNAIDEGGYIAEEFEDEPYGMPGVTRIFVDMETPVTDFYQNMWRYLEVKEPAYKVVTDNGEVNFHEPNTRNAKSVIYRKGVRCNQLDNPEEKVALYRYDIPGLSIGEDRIYSSYWDVSRAVTWAWYAIKDENSIERLLKVFDNPNYFEGNLSWPTAGQGDMSTEWKTVLKDSLICAKGYIPFLPPGDIQRMTVVPNGVYASLKACFPELSFVDEPSNFAEVQGSKEQIHFLEKALAELESYGYKIHEVSYVFVEFKKADTIAAYEDGEVRLSVKHLLEEKDFLPAILMEYFHHLGHNNGTRELEHFMVTELVKAIKKAQKAEENEIALFELNLIKGAFKTLKGLFD